MYTILSDFVPCHFFISGTIYGPGYHYVTGICMAESDPYIRIDSTWYPTNDISYRFIKGLKSVKAPVFLYLEKAVALVNHSEISDVYFVDFTKMRRELKTSDFNAILA